MMLRRLANDCGAATGAEFAMVLPLLLILLFGIIDGGRFMWEYNRAAKATQVGARVAVVTDSVPTGLQSEEYVGQTVTLADGSTQTLTQGDRIPSTALGKITCTRDLPCECTLAPCPDDPGSIDTTVFDNVLLRRMQAMDPAIQADNVELEYTGSGLGYAGDPHGMQIAPIVTVRLTGLQFVPVTSLLFATLTMPDFRTSMPAEDASGDQSN